MQFWESCTFVVELFSVLSVHHPYFYNELTVYASIINQALISCQCLVAVISYLFTCSQITNIRLCQMKTCKYMHMCCPLLIYLRIVILKTVAYNVMLKCNVGRANCSVNVLYQNTSIHNRTQEEAILKVNCQTLKNMLQLSRNKFNVQIFIVQQSHQFCYRFVIM